MILKTFRMECIWDLPNCLREIRRTAWMNVHTNAEEPVATQLKADYQNIINESIFGMDLDALITRLDGINLNQNKTEKMAIDAMIEYNFISLDIASMTPLEGRLMQLYHFFKNTISDRNAEVHRAIAQTIMIRNQCIIRALLYHSKTGHVININPEWFLPSLMLVPPVVSSPFSLIQILTRNRDLRFPWYGAHNATTPVRVDVTAKAMDTSRRSSMASETDNSS